MKRLRLAVLSGIAASGVAAALWLFLPLPASLTAHPQLPSLTIEDRNGLVLRTTRAGDGSRTSWTPLDAIDPQLIQAFVASEDRRFFAHAGVDLRAVARAIAQNVRHTRAVSGASTITMQLARLLHPAPRGWAAKLSQALWAVRLERHLSKQQILEQYLNRVPLGQGAVGVEAAAELYFGADVGRLSLGQAALLAGLASAPSADNPLVNAARASRRRDEVLRRMAALGYASADAVARAAQEPALSRAAAARFLAPHFTTYIIGAAGDSTGALDTGWRTSLDLPLQAEIEAEVRHTVALLEDRGAQEAAAVVLDNQSGEILAWVGSPDFWSDSAGQVDMVVSPRQPGSALKPFLYALAFDHGYTPDSILPDEPKTYLTPLGPYVPRNYDRRYHGDVTIRVALASSFNVPAVEMTDRMGAGTLLDVLHDAGFASLDQPADHYGLGLVIGNGDVTLLELANAYRGLANGGVRSPVRWLAAEPGYRAPLTGPRFASANAAGQVLDVLTDAAARIPGFGVDTPFDFPFVTAVKTGTSHHFTDNWAAAVTGNFTVAVWVGNFTGRPMRQVSGVTGAGPLLHRVVMDVARRYDPGVLRTLSPPRAQPPALLAARAPEREARLRIASPLDGDRYQVPAGADARYATIPLRAEGAPAGARIRWTVDGRPVEDRWRLAAGTHRVRASAAGQSAEVTIDVR